MKLDQLYAKLDAWAPHTLSILRIMAGLLFFEHGLQKLFAVPDAGGGAVPLLSLIGLAGLIELVGGALIIVGLVTRISAFIISGEMAFAYFMAHAPQGFMPIENGGELAMLYCFLFFYLIFAGPGSWSVDAMMKPGGPTAQRA
jgi:putative oxidoreductase